MSENCTSLILQDKCNIELFLSPDLGKYMYLTPDSRALVLAFHAPGLEGISETRFPSFMPGISSIWEGRHI